MNGPMAEIGPSQGTARRLSMARRSRGDRPCWSLLTGHRSPNRPLAQGGFKVIRDVEIEGLLHDITDPVLDAAGISPGSRQSLHRSGQEPERLRRRWS